jgi:hypothetical protein
MANPGVLIVGAVVLVVFLGIRRFWWWYWGIGRMVAAFEDIAVSLRCLPGRQQLDQAAQKRPRRVA